MHEYRAKVTKIIDGDTIKCDIDLGFSTILSNQTVRLFGIDTPESRTRDTEEKFYGKLATRFLKDQCKKGSCITLRTYLDKKGKYGRILGEIIIDGVNVNQLMVEEHMAVEYHGQSKIDIHKGHMFNRQVLNRAGINYS
jgi:micrococcal nuclease